MARLRKPGRPKRAGKYERVNLDMRVEVKRRVEQIRNDTHASSIAMVLERALAVYDYVQSVERDGGKVVVHHADDTQERLKLMP